MAGYSSYAPSKAAVKSLADTLRNEVRFNVTPYAALIDEHLPESGCAAPMHCSLCPGLFSEEVIDVQLLPTGVRVSIAYPPDTDTPGYANENTTKVFFLPGTSCPL